MGSSVWWLRCNASIKPYCYNNHAFEKNHPVHSFTLDVSVASDVIDPYDLHVIVDHVVPANFQAK